jgi:hypothetical protein
VFKQPGSKGFVFAKGNSEGLRDDVIAVAFQILAVAFKLGDELAVKLRFDPGSGFLIL